MPSCVKPAPRSWLSIAVAARRDVVAVAPGQRGWESAVTIVAAIRLQSDAGFTLAEQKALIAPRDGAPGWRELAQRKLAELDERIARAQAARDAISHGLRCPRRAATQRPDFQAVCPDFQARIAARRPGPAAPRSHQR